jgi:hypothetical protein
MWPFLTLPIQLIFFILLQHQISKLLWYIWSVYHIWASYKFLMPRNSDVIPILLRRSRSFSVIYTVTSIFVPGFVLEVPLVGENRVLFVKWNFPRKSPCYVHSQPKRNWQLSCFIKNFSTSLTIPCRRLFPTIEATRSGALGEVLVKWTHNMCPWICRTDLG